MSDKKETQASPPEDTGEDIGDLIERVDQADNSDVVVTLEGETETPEETEETEEQEEWQQEQTPQTESPAKIDPLEVLTEQVSKLTAQVNYQNRQLKKLVKPKKKSQQQESPEQESQQQESPEQESPRQKRKKRRRRVIR